MKSQKATHEQLKRHNRQLLLRAVYDGLADNRAALVQLNGLARPTVSSLVSEIIAEGLLSERGRGPAKEGGGKRPRLLEFMPDAKQVIGVGFGDGPEAAAAGLTTVAADVVELGRRGARQLIGQLEGLRIRGLTLLKTTLVSRQTSRQ